jgi:ribA/ribD-fused uncharacterized protein
MIESFMGKFRYLSNFHESPLRYGGREFRNSEAAYQSEKFLDPTLKDQFIGLNGKDSKRLSVKLKEFLRPDWFDVNIFVMSEIVHAKFTQDGEICAWLVLTDEEELIEGNYWHDEFWGVCNGKCRKGPHEPEGQNWLGKILMAERVYWKQLLKG